MMQENVGVRKKIFRSWISESKSVTPLITTGYTLYHQCLFAEIALVYGEDLLLTDIFQYMLRRSDQSIST